MEDFEDVNKRIRRLNVDGSTTTPIKLRLQRQGEADYCYIFDRKVPLGKLLKDYCKLESFVYGTMRFLYDGNRVPADKCADDREMEDEDTIDVFFDQYGGSLA